MASAWSSRARSLVVVALSVACAEILGVDPIDSNDAGGGPPRGGSSGSDATGGSNRGGVSGRAGTGGDGIGGAETSRGGIGAGESGGGGYAADVATGGTKSGGGSGEGGEGGAATIPEWPRVGDPCTVAGALACWGPASPLRLLCNGTRWDAWEPCQSELCDRRTGACGAIMCALGSAYCSGDTLFVCGPDRVSQHPVLCPFGCPMNGDECTPPELRERAIDLMFGSDGDRRPWPDPLVSVCFRDNAPSPEIESAREALRFAVDTSWGRYSAVSFTGWRACEEENAGVEVEFIRECRGELARVSNIGYPGAGLSILVELCTSHFDQAGTLHPPAGSPPDLELLAFVGQHAFGHVLGREDTEYDAVIPHLMARALHLDEYRSITLNAVDIERLQRVYGKKPAGSWVAPNGRCLTAASSPSAPTTAPCDGTSEQRFRLEGSRFFHEATLGCVRADGSAVSVDACTADPTREAFRADRVRWIARGGDCVTVPQTPLTNSSTLVVQPCDPSFPARQTFGFEVVGDGRVRIRTATGCVRWPATLGMGSIPELGACNGTRDTFESRDGQLSAEGRCLSLYSAWFGLDFRPCTAGADYYFFMSGAFELAGQALTLSESGELRLQALSVGWPPEREQIFDYHF